MSKFGREEGFSIFKPRTDTSINSNDLESLCNEIHHKKDKNILFSVMYRPPHVDI